MPRVRPWRAGSGLVLFNIFANDLKAETNNCQENVISPSIVEKAHTHPPAGREREPRELDKTSRSWRLDGEGGWGLAGWEARVAKSSPRGRVLFSVVTWE